MDLALCQFGGLFGERKEGVGRQGPGWPLTSSAGAVRYPALVLRLGGGTVGGGRGWSAGTATGAVAAHVRLHGFEFLLLIVGEQSFDAVVCAFGDGPHLGAPVFRSARLILHEGLHLLLTLQEERLNLRLLVRGQVELTGEALELAVGVHAHAAAATLRWSGLILILGWGRVVLGEGGAGDAEGEQSGERHVGDLGLHKSVNPPILGEEQAPPCGPGLCSSIVFPGEQACRGVPFREVDGKEQGRDEEEAVFAWELLENGPKKLEAGASASGVEDSRNRLPAGP